MKATAIFKLLLFCIEYFDLTTLAFFYLPCNTLTWTGTTTQVAKNATFISIILLTDRPDSLQRCSAGSYCCCPYLTGCIVRPEWCDAFSGRLLFFLLDWLFLLFLRCLLSSLLCGFLSSLLCGFLTLLLYWFFFFLFVIILFRFLIIVILRLFVVIFGIVIVLIIGVRIVIVFFFILFFVFVLIVFIFGLLLGSFLSLLHWLLFLLCLRLVFFCYIVIIKNVVILFQLFILRSFTAFIRLLLRL